MRFSKFNISVLLLVLLICLTCGGLAFFVLKQNMPITTFNIAILLLIEVGYLLFYVKKTNRDLERFFQAFQYQDTTLLFDETKPDKKFRNLHINLNRIIKQFNKVLIERENEKHYLENTIQHIGIGIMAVNSDNEVQVVNDALLNLLSLKKIKKIEDLAAIQKDLPTKLKLLRPDRKEIIKIQNQQKFLQLSIRKTEFKLREKVIHLFSFQDISAELMQGEVEAWQKMISILTHEIMNSVSPITLVSSGLIETLEEEKDLKKIDKNRLSNSIEGLKAIKKRSSGLTSFIESYRKVSKIPDLNITNIKISELLQHINTLFSDELNKYKIKISIEVIPKDLTIDADEKLIEQVLINIIKNAIEAIKNIKNPEINIIASKKYSETNIQIKDNGKGIPNEILDHIFTPFFTTKENGSGIGLSFSRQVMLKHKGNINVSSSIEEGTTFTLTF